MSTLTTIPTIEDDLKRQHQFVEEQRHLPEAFNLVVPEAFVQSIRDLGYKSTYNALDELVDNAVQANATLVGLFLAYADGNKSKKKPDYIVVADNGHGMEPDMIRLAVKWGGTHRHDDRKGFGRYGFGLPSACVSIGRAYTVYSKVPGDDWHAVTVDIDKVAKSATTGKPFQTHDRKEAPPKFVGERVDVAEYGSGTVIVIETLDRLSSGFRTTTAFVRNMKEHVGLIYRKLMPAIDIKVAGDRVQPVDPLFLDPNARWHDDTPIKAEAVEAIEFELKNERDETGWVRIRGSAFPYNFHLKDPDGQLNKSNHNPRYQIMTDCNGIIVCRAGRQIDTVGRLPWTTFVNFDRFWAIEIDFDPVLDEYFGITTHKQQVGFSESMIDHLKNQGLKSLIEDLRRRMKKSRSTIKAELEKRERKQRAAERAMAAAAKKKPRAAATPPKQGQKADENLEREAKKQAEVTGEPTEKARERVAQQAEKEPYKVDFESVPDGPIFRGERMGKQYRLIINTLHRFYTDVYEPAGRVAGLKSKIETALFVVAEAELDAEIGSEQEAFYKAGRIYLSQRLTDVLADLDADGDTEDEVSAEMEDDEAAANEVAA